MHLRERRHCNTVVVMRHELRVRNGTVTAAQWRQGHGTSTYVVFLARETRRFCRGHVGDLGGRDLVEAAAGVVDGSEGTRIGHGA